MSKWKKLKVEDLDDSMGLAVLDSYGKIIGQISLLEYRLSIKSFVSEVQPIVEQIQIYKVLSLHYVSMGAKDGDEILNIMENTIKHYETILEKLIKS